MANIKLKKRIWQEIAILCIFLACLIFGLSVVLTKRFTPSVFFGECIVSFNDSNYVITNADEYHALVSLICFPRWTVSFVSHADRGNAHIKIGSARVRLNKKGKCVIVFSDGRLLSSYTADIPQSKLDSVMNKYTAESQFSIGAIFVMNRLRTDYD